MVEVAEHLLDGALFRRHRTAGLGIPVCPDRLRCGGAGADVAKPRALYLEGRSPCRRHAAGHALSLHVRHGGARHSRRLPSPHRIEDRLSRLRTPRARRRARSHGRLLHGHADGARRHADRFNPDPCSCRFVVAA